MPMTVVLPALLISVGMRWAVAISPTLHRGWLCASLEPKRCPRRNHCKHIYSSNKWIASFCSAKGKLHSKCAFPLSCGSWVHTAGQNVELTSTGELSSMAQEHVRK